MHHYEFNFFFDLLMFFLFWNRRNQISLYKRSRNLLQKHCNLAWIYWVLLILLGSFPYHHDHLFNIFCSWLESKSLPRIDWLGLGTALSNRGVCICMHPQFWLLLPALSYESVCLWECSRNTPRWTCWQQRASGPSASRLKSHLCVLIVPVAQSL